MRICIAGGPQVGKTTLARELHGSRTGWTLCSTDETGLVLDWSAQSDSVVPFLNHEGPWIVEGVPVIRALRKWLRSHPTGQPCDTLYWRFAARQTRSEGQERLAKGCLATFNEIRGDLERRGVQILTF